MTRNNTLLVFETPNMLFVAGRSSGVHNQTTTENTLQIIQKNKPSTLIIKVISFSSYCVYYTLLLPAGINVAFILSCSKLLWLRASAVLYERCVTRTRQSVFGRSTQCQKRTWNGATRNAVESQMEFIIRPLCRQYRVVWFTTTKPREIWGEVRGGRITNRSNAR